MLIVPQVYAATPSYLSGVVTGCTTSSCIGAEGSYPGDLYNLCNTQVSGQVSIQAGGSTLIIQLPYLPTLNCVNNFPYQIPPVCGGTALNAKPCPVFPPPFGCPSVAWYNPLSWGTLISCIGEYIVTFASTLGTWIIDVVILNPLITGLNEVWGVLSYVGVYIINSLISIINFVIVAFDAIPLGIGGIVISFVSVIPEPYSAFLEPWVWLIVLAVIVLMLVAILFFARLAVKAIKSGAQVAEVAA